MSEREAWGETSAIFFSTPWTYAELVNQDEHVNVKMVRAAFRAAWNGRGAADAEVAKEYLSGVEAADGIRGLDEKPSSTSPP